MTRARMQRTDAQTRTPKPPVRQQERSTTDCERETASTDPGLCSIAERGEVARRALSLAGRYRSGCRDLAEDHDKDLDEAFD